jgi:hypothetical protein
MNDDLMRRFGELAAECWNLITQTQSLIEDSRCFLMRHRLRLAISQRIMLAHRAHPQSKRAPDACTPPHF